MRRSTEVQGEMYRRGLVLGLTMAEVILLVTFVLLITAATLLSRERTIIKESQNMASDLQATLDQTKRELSEARIRIGLYEKIVPTSELTQQMGKAILEEEIDELWRRITIGEKSVAYMNKHQLSHEDFVGRATKFVEIRELVEKMRSIKMSDAEVVQALRGEPKIDGVTKFSTTSSGHNWPPIITLSEAAGFYFELGRATLSDDFRDQLIAEIVPRLLEIVQQYDVTVVEVIGHTDETPIRFSKSNLDSELVSVLNANGDAAVLIASDNAGLGMARAAAVAVVLRADKRLVGLQILPLSGAQAIDVNDRLATGEFVDDTRERRRIEIRVRRSSK